MTREEFDVFCGKLQSSTNVIQWGNATVWKIGGKIFAVCSNWGLGEEQKVSFKCSDHSYHILCELPGIIPAPYLARAKWVQITNNEAMNNDDIQAYIDTAYKIICKKLTRAKRTELGIE